jgi:tetratricopeptide (TPR) repeat protein
LVESVWGQETPEQDQLRHIKQMQDRLPLLRPELRAQLDALPDLAPLLAQLVSVGLVNEQHKATDDTNPNLSCHELVCERIRAWMAQHPQDRAELSERVIHLAYAERLEAVFEELMHPNMTAALDAGSRALVYYIKAEAWDQLGGFASGLVTNARDPRLLEKLLPYLQTAAQSAPEGEHRWCCLCNLADALRLGNRADASLPLYYQASIQARAVAESGGVASRQAWSNLGAITANWAVALTMNGDLAEARERQLDSAEANKQAGRPAIYVIGNELEALRIDIMQGQTATALPEVEARLAQVDVWWRQHRAGQPAPEAPDLQFLARVLISALDIAAEADIALEDWPAALRRLDTSLDVQYALNRPAEDIAATRTNRANILCRLHRYDEAMAELETCLTLLENNPAMSARVRASLASLFNQQGDLSQAIMQARRALASLDTWPEPKERSILHNNLSNYLDRSGIPSDFAESAKHQLAALIYRLIAELWQLLQNSLRKFAVSFRLTLSPNVPTVADLLADPAFAPLEQWLRQRQIPLDPLQSAVDHFLAQARQLAESHDDPATP